MKTDSGTLFGFRLEILLAGIIDTYEEFSKIIEKVGFVRRETRRLSVSVVMSKRGKIVSMTQKP
jgi:hypothetical protein